MKVAMFSFLCAVASVVSAAQMTSPPKWPEKGQHLWLSVYPLGIPGGEGSFSPCEEMKVFEVFPKDNQVWLKSELRTETSPYTVTGDWTALLAEAHAKCLMRLRRLQKDKPINCRLLGFPEPCESERPVPIVKPSPLDDFSSPAGWRVVGQIPAKAPAAKIIASPHPPITSPPPETKGGSLLALIASHLMWDAEPLTLWQRWTIPRKDQTCPESGYCFRRTLVLHCSSLLNGIPRCYNEVTYCGAPASIIRQDAAETTLELFSTEGHPQLKFHGDLRPFTYLLGDSNNYRQAATMCYEKAAAEETRPVRMGDRLGGN